ncbi:MAG: hypothetical protein AW12_00032 [Candidatus Accumulibacter sp. BA-94]|nr:MAG: hypothetical protein AW12_00032 [Candidatus Accumulibacter sp. BA-94]
MPAVIDIDFVRRGDTGHGEAVADEEASGAHLAAHLLPQCSHRGRREEGVDDIVARQIGLPEIAPAPRTVGSGQRAHAADQPGGRCVLDRGEGGVRSRCGQWLDDAADAGAEVEEAQVIVLARQRRERRDGPPAGEVERDLAGQSAAIDEQQQHEGEQEPAWVDLQQRDAPGQRNEDGVQDPPPPGLPAEGGEEQGDRSGGESRLRPRQLFAANAVVGPSEREHGEHGGELQRQLPQRSRQRCCGCVAGVR